MSPLKKTDGVVQLDKSAEKTLPFDQQATLSPQIATALMYLVFGLYEGYLPGKYKSVSDLGSSGLGLI